MRPPYVCRSHAYMDRPSKLSSFVNRSVECVDKMITVIITKRCSRRLVETYRGVSKSIEKYTTEDRNCRLKPIARTSGVFVRGSSSATTTRGLWEVRVTQGACCKYTGKTSRRSRNILHIHPPSSANEELLYNYYYYYYFSRKVLRTHTYKFIGRGNPRI